MGEVEYGEQKAKNKEQKERNRKRKRKVGSHKIETGAEGALIKSYRKRKAEVCSVKKDGAAESAGRSSREEGYWLTEGCAACMKKCMERDCRRSGGRYRS